MLLIPHGVVDYLSGREQAFRVTPTEVSEPSGAERPELRVAPPGPESRRLFESLLRAQAPMGPAAEAALGLVLARGVGSNVWDVDGNRYLDLAAGFGALPLGHGHPAVLSAIERQSRTLLQALGDVCPTPPKIELLEALGRLHPELGSVILGQSGSDAVAAALKTARLFTGRPGVIAFEGAYHGLGYGPLALCGLRPGYREPFLDQLNPHHAFVEYPTDHAGLERALSQAREALKGGQFGAILAEPILGRGGVLSPPRGFFSELERLARESGALLIADEIWTGLGRSGRLLHCTDEAVPDLVCLGKGLGGGLPISAVVGRRAVLESWRREPEVVHTSTFAGAPLAAAAALATIEVLERDCLAERSRSLGWTLRGRLEEIARRHPGAEVRGAGLMLGIGLDAGPGSGSRLQRALLERGYLTSTGGGQREVVILTPPLNIDEERLLEVDDAVDGALAALRA